MVDRTCAVADCASSKINARGMCSKHYERWRLTGSVDHIPKPRKPAPRPRIETPCVVVGCVRMGVRGRGGRCRTHQDRWTRNGDVGSPDIEVRLKYEPGQKCSIDGCPNTPESRGWCGKHYMRFLIHGDPTIVIGRERTGVRSCFRCECTPDEVPFRADKRAPDGLGAYCKPCESDYNRRYYATNHDRLNAENNARYYANRDRYLAHMRAHRLANIETYRERARLRGRGNPQAIARSREYRRLHPDHCRELVRRWYRDHPENRERVKVLGRQWRDRNPQRHRDIVHSAVIRRHARMRGEDGQMERISRRAVWDRDHGTCGLCAEPVAFFGMHVDHIKPLSKGGPHTFANVQATHRECNLRKGNREVPRWAYATASPPGSAESTEPS